MTVKHRE